MSTTRILTVLTVLLAAGAAEAQTDSLRCEARQMRAESQYYRCLSRCDRRADRVAARPADRRGGSESGECAATCAARLGDDIARIGGKAPCVTTPPAADPHDCEAQLLRLSASMLRCAARCGRQHRRDGFDQNACLADCETRCGTAADILADGPTCADGRMGTADVCVLH